ncbi:hypothetical protein A0H81_04427 [Grifola frondosa]|uniref:Sfi1 spindle body domain-containing protein n=1 Tax=Grifola frondosa TaxID=5627 RepID=A0A1C7MEE8_GRIFR|nr:hypothetical protein A0H81_04427 [Grifola frondosa]
MKSIFKRAMSSSPPLIEPAPLHRAISQPRERRNSVINEDDAWKKIKMARDEQEADRFRQERLVDRCWEVWKQGYQWIITTHEQIAEARDHLILRLALRRWHNLTISRREIYQRVSALSNRRCLKVALNLWEDKLKEKRQAQWRDNMRSRMREVREKRELKLKKDAWAKWRQSYRSHLSEQHYSERLVLRFLKRWQAKVHRLDELDAAAEHFMYAKEEAQIEQCWNMWQHAMDMRRAEKEMKARVALRVMAEAMVVWKKRIRAYQVADEFYDVVVVKRALGAWKASRDRIRALEHRATKHLTRQNDVLVRAVMRVWKAHERGKLMEGVRTHKLLKQAWVVWKQRVRDRRGQEDLALAFSMRSSSALASASLQKWRQAFLTHRNAQTFAVHYHSAQVQYKTLLVWRLQLRVRLKMNRQAKVAHKFFLMRSCWHKLIIKVEERRRESKLKAFEVQITKRFFKEWLDGAQRQRERKLAEEIMKQRISTRVMMDALAHWTNRVADLKFSELEVTQRYEKAILASAFKKWKALCIRHVEELSLMESYQDVKREENMRRMFYRWLAAARKSRHRRLYLQQKEDEMKLTAVAAAWDRWRERFQDIRLQPIADDFIIQHQKNLMFRAFGIWHSKTRSLPAVRFHASHAKAKFWHIWREAMPRALQAKAAREMDRKSVLSKALDKWLHTYRTKIELKAVARARYLRLPTAAPRHTTLNARPPTALLSASRSSFLTRSGRSTDGNDPGPGPAPARPSAGRGKFGIASLLTSKPPERVVRPRLSSRGSSHATSVRAPSPTHSVSSSYGPGARGGDGGVRVKRGPASVAGGEVARSSLWQELREVRRKSRPLANRSEAGEPP